MILFIIFLLLEKKTVTINWLTEPINWLIKLFSSVYISTNILVQKNWTVKTIQFSFYVVLAFIQFISLLSGFCTPVESCSFLDWNLFGGSVSASWSFSSVYLFSRWFPSTLFFHAAALVMLYLGGLAWTKQ
jgi:hypothetical protein